MSETLSVTMSETSRVVKRDLAVMGITGIIRYEGKDNVGVNPSNCRCKYPSSRKS